MKESNVISQPLKLRFLAAHVGHELGAEVEVLVRAKVAVHPVVLDRCSHSSVILLVGCSDPSGNGIGSPRLADDELTTELLVARHRTEGFDIGDVSAYLKPERPSLGNAPQGAGD